MKALKALFWVGLILEVGTVGAADSLTLGRFLLQSLFCLALMAVGFFGGRLYE